MARACAKCLPDMNDLHYFQTFSDVIISVQTYLRGFFLCSIRWLPALIARTDRQVLLFQENLLQTWHWTL